MKGKVCVQVILYDDEGESFSVDPHDVHRVQGLDGDHENNDSTLHSISGAEDTGELPPVGGV